MSNDVFRDATYRRPPDVTGLTKLATVFGVRYAAPHEWARPGATVQIAEGRQFSRSLNRCYVVGLWPQPRSAIARRRREILAGLSSAK